ncbi:hypothetical protein ABIG06_001489 [Bradyrhizobium sp. USDA 326]|uniref:alkaline phosphatase family protein n=1 Tax=Bradyrhizobium sp. USDA 326 TaxID=3377726 RepID=UPI003C70A111
MKFIAIVFDGLRPDQIDERVTPNLCALARAGLRLDQHTASFPSETRVSSAAIATGSHGSGHGIVGNKFFTKGQFIDGASLPTLLSLGSETQGVLTSTAIGEVLRAHGRTMLSIGSQSQGSWGLSSWGSWQSDAPAFWVHDPKKFSSNPIVHRIASTFPELPKGEAPALDTIKRVVDVFFSYVACAPLPDLTLLWLSEPDISYHLFGLAHPKAREVLSKVDGEFGRILNWWDAERSKQQLQLIAASDHGHAIIGEKVSVSSYLAKAGFAVGAEFSDKSNVVLTAQRAVNIWVRDKDLGLLSELHHCLSETPWFGVAFSRTMPDGLPLLETTLPHSAVFAEHARSPDLSFVLGDCAQTNRDSSPDTVFYDGTYPVGVGMHGGLTRFELSSLCILAGDHFGHGVLTTPTSIVDLAPTILNGLGLPLPQTVQGRVMEEASHAQPTERYSADDASLSVTSSRRQAVLHRVRYRERLYLKGAEINWNAAEKRGSESRPPITAG